MSCSPSCQCVTLPNCWLIQIWANGGMLCFVASIHALVCHLNLCRNLSPNKIQMNELYENPASHRCTEGRNFVLGFKYVYFYCKVRYFNTAVYGDWVTYCRFWDSCVGFIQSCLIFCTIFHGSQSYSFETTDLLMGTNVTAVVHVQKTDQSHSARLKRSYFIHSWKYTELVISSSSDSDFERTDW